MSQGDKLTQSLVISSILFHTIRNTVIGCTLSEAILRKPHLKHYQKWFISLYPLQLLRVELFAAVHHEEPLLIIL
jgi:hypothetical protein